MSSAQNSAWHIHSIMYFIYNTPTRQLKKAKVLARLWDSRNSYTFLVAVKIRSKVKTHPSYDPAVIVHG